MTRQNNALRWPKTTELIGLSFELQPGFNSEMYPQYAIALHAWFLDQVRQSNPELSAALHDNPNEKAFTMSRLKGKLTSNNLSVGVSGDEIYRWSITSMSKTLSLWMAQWVKVLPDNIFIRDTPLNIRGVSIELKPTTYNKLWKEAAQMERVIILNFDTPTSFRSRSHHMPLPIPRNLFQSYLRRWNAFAKHTVEMTPFLEWVEKAVVIRRHQLSSIKTVAGKSGAVTGFIGSIELGLDLRGKQEQRYLQMFNALGLYAPYCGTGHKTTFGLGGTRAGWSDLWKEQTLVTAEEILSDRVASLTAVFMAQRKRQGKERAIRTAKQWATILARREFGDSLGDIAQDLEIPYQSAKTYSKLARRALRDG